MLLHTRSHRLADLFRHQRGRARAKLWKLLPPRCRTCGDLIRELQAEYPEVESSTLLQDAVELLADLKIDDQLSIPAPEDDLAPSDAPTPQARQA